MVEDATQPSTVHTEPPSNTGGQSAERSSSGGGSPRDPAPARPHGIEHISQAQETEYEGDSSLAAHADFTARILESAVTRDSLTSRCDDLAAMMRDVQHTNKLKSADGPIGTNSQSPPPPLLIEPRHPPLPPVQQTLNCLRMLKGQLCPVATQPAPLGFSMLGLDTAAPMCNKS